MLVFALIEASRMAMVCATLSYAAQEGCRTAIAAGSTISDVEKEIAAALQTGFVSNVDVTITPSDLSNATEGTQVTVTLEVPYREVSWLPVPQFLGNRVLRATATMRREGR